MHTDINTGFLPLFESLSEKDQMSIMNRIAHVRDSCGGKPVPPTAKPLRDIGGEDIAEIRVQLSSGILARIHYFVDGDTFIILNAYTKPDGTKNTNSYNKSKHRALEQEIQSHINEAIHLKKKYKTNQNTMTYSMKDLKDLINSDEFKAFQELDNRLIRLGEKIYGRRKDLLLTQSELAEKADIPQNKISLLECGTYGEPGREILERLSSALEIDLNYFLLDSIDRKTFEVYNYILPRITLHEEGRLQMIKIPYFIDLEAYREQGRRITNYRYIRYQYGPFDGKLYAYSGLFFGHETGFENITFSSLNDDEKKIIDRVLSTLPVNDGNALKKRSYETYPMKNLGATLGGREGWNEELVF